MRPPTAQGRSCDHLRHVAAITSAPWRCRLARVVSPSLDAMATPPSPRRIEKLPLQQPTDTRNKPVTNLALVGERGRHTLKKRGAQARQKVRCRRQTGHIVLIPSFSAFDP
jgi:hypothetical protein